MEACPNTEPTLLLIESVAGTPPERDQNKVEDCPKVMAVDDAVKLLMTGAGDFTVTVTCLFSLPVELEAVRVYVVVVAGETTFDEDSNTEPTLLSISKFAAAPPESVHARVTGCPEIIVVVEEVNVFIIGAGALIM